MIDIETRSEIDLNASGVYRYVEGSAFEILLFAYKIDEAPTQIIDLKCGEPIPKSIKELLARPDVVKRAFNAAFEIACLNAAGYRTPVAQWECTMIHGAYLGYPLSLAQAGSALGLPADSQKMKAGKSLIKYFCTPQEPTRKNGNRIWNNPVHDPDKWNLFKEYCIRDVDAEYAIEQRLSQFPVPEAEWEQWHMDIEMNTFGIHTDRALVEGALAVNAVSEDRLYQEAQQITGLANPNSTAQLQEWLNERIPLDIKDLTKETVSDLLNEELPEDARKALELRQQMSKTSIKKYETMHDMICRDDRIRGISQFYGARTGRWAGRGVQMQNLTKHHIGTLDLARELVQKKDYLSISLLYGDVPDLLSQIVRTAFIASDGRKFVVADFSAIEARVIAWLAGEEWVNEVFATHGKIYEATASQMFGVPVERIRKGNPEYELRQKGKVATLALGYQGGKNSLISMGALKMGIPEEELPDIVNRWRNANPKIRELWYALENAALDALETSLPQTVMPNGSAGVVVRYEMDILYGLSFLTIELPGGRKLYYPKPYITENQFGRQALHFYAQKAGHWVPDSTYGGKLTENVVQAVARDCLAEVLGRLKQRGLDFVFHVHDEVIVDAPADLTVEELCALMSEPIPWAPGLILKGAGFESPYYKKD